MFVPLWIVLCLSLVGCLYSCIFCSILWRTPEIAPAAKKAAFAAALGNCATVLPLLAFQILLADQLDGDLQWTHVAVVSPLLLALGTLTLLSFQAKGGNKWWFGIRKPLGKTF